MNWTYRSWAKSSSWLWVYRIDVGKYVYHSLGCKAGANSAFFSGTARNQSNLAFGIDHSALTEKPCYLHQICALQQPKVCRFGCDSQSRLDRCSGTPLKFETDSRISNSAKDNLRENIWENYILYQAIHRLRQVVRVHLRVESPRCELLSTPDTAVDQYLAKRCSRCK